MLAMSDKVAKFYRSHTTISH